jgi:hypothetical protein
MVGGVYFPSPMSAAHLGMHALLLVVLSCLVLEYKIVMTLTSVLPKGLNSKVVDVEYPIFWLRYNEFLYDIFVSFKQIPNLRSQIPTK